MVPSPTDTPSLYASRFFGGRDAVAPIALILGIVALLAGDSFIREDAYTEVGYVLTLLSALGSVACIGYMFLFIRSLKTCQQVSFSRRLVDGTLVRATHGGEDWPLFVRMLFSPFVALFSGLAGWVVRAWSRLDHCLPLT